MLYRDPKFYILPPTFRANWGEQEVDQFFPEGSGTLKLLRGVEFDYMSDALRKVRTDDHLLCVGHDKDGKPTRCTVLIPKPGHW